MTRTVTDIGLVVIEQTKSFKTTFQILRQFESLLVEFMFHVKGTQTHSVFINNWGVSEPLVLVKIGLWLPGMYCLTNNNSFVIHKLAAFAIPAMQPRTCFLWLSQVRANERRRYLYDVVSHWLRPCSATDMKQVLFGLKTKGHAFTHLYLEQKGDSITDVHQNISLTKTPRGITDEYFGISFMDKSAMS